MEENSYTNMLREQSEALCNTFRNSIPVCLAHGNCRSCPFYDKNMTNEADSHCFSSLMAYYSRKLLDIADSIDGKDEENHAKEN